MTKCESCDIGLVGLGIMGQNLVLNMADQGVPVAVYNRTAEKTEDFISRRAGDRSIVPGYGMEEFVSLLKRPRPVMLMIQSGKPVDIVIGKLAPLLQEGDMIVDCGNSHFSDTDRRREALEEKGILYLGMGISGGEFGARHGPSMMPGGAEKGYNRIKPIVEKTAAQVDGDPCAAYLGKGSAGHYVKMIHNGIEYGIQQLIAESYDLMKRGLGLDNGKLHEIFGGWNRQELDSFLMEITADIFSTMDEKTDGHVVDVILDVARQKGTGLWTAKEANDLRVPAPTIHTAVGMRIMSELKDERKRASRLLNGPQEGLGGDAGDFVDKLKNGLYAAFIVTYAQGMALLRRASDQRGYDFDLEAVARIWRGGCIIRSVLLQDIRAAYLEQPGLPHLLLNRNLAQKVMSRQQDWRDVVQAAARWGIPAAGFMASLAYYDSFRSARLPANLIQAQRDYFGAHTYERIDREGTFHTEWFEEK